MYETIALNVETYQFEMQIHFGIAFVHCGECDMLRREFVVAKCLTAPQNCTFTKLHPGTLAG